MLKATSCSSISLTVISPNCAQHPAALWGLAVPALGSVVPGAGLAVLVAIHKGHLMTAHGGVAECLQAPLRVSREKTDVKDQLRVGGGEDMDK